MCLIHWKNCQLRTGAERESGDDVIVLQVVQAAVLLNPNHCAPRDGEAYRPALRPCL